jgi:hypothetical protein
MKVKIDVELLQKTVNYLQKKPYEEVYQLIHEIITEANKEDAKIENTETLPGA